MLDEYRGIPWQAQLLIYLSVVPSIALGFLYTDISYYLTTVQKIVPFWEGVIITTIGLSIVAFSIPLGILADRYGRRKMLILGNVFQGTGLLGFAFTTDIGLLLLFAAAEGIGEAAFAVSLSALIADRAGDDKRTPAFSLAFFLNWIGSGVGALSISSTAFIPDAELFVVIGLASVAVTPIALGVTDTQHLGARKGVLPRKSGRVLTRYAVYAAALGTGSGFFVTLMTQWFKGRYDVPNYVGSNVLTASYFVTAGVILLSPRLAKRVGTVEGIVLAQAPATVLMLAIPSSPSFIIAGVLYAARVFLMNMANPLGQSVVMGLVSPDERASAAGLIAISNRLPNSVTAFPGAILIGAGFFDIPFYIATVCYAFAIFWLWLMFRNARLPEEERLATRNGPSRPSWKDSLRPAGAQQP